MSAISPPPMGYDAEEKVQTDNREALATLRKEKPGSVAAVIGSALALGLVGAVFATLGARRSRRPWYARLVSMF